MRHYLTLILIFVAACLAAIGQGVPSNVPQNGLVAYFGFDGNANDLSGHGNNGDVRGPSLTTDRFGNPNSAYEFGGRGSRDHIRVYNDASLRFTNAVTISFWMLQTSPLGTAWQEYYDYWYGYTYGTEVNASSDATFTVIAKGGLGYDYNYGGLCVITSMSSSRRQHFDMKITGNNGNFQNVGAEGYMNCYHYGQWIHVVQVIDGNKSRLYVNGVLIAELYTETPNFSRTNNSDMYIGQQVGTSSPWFTFSGKLDDIAIYNRAVTDSEVRSLFNNYRDPNDSENHIDIDNIGIQQPCGAEAGTITINPRPNGSMTYSYAFTSPNSPQANNVLSAGPGTHRVYVVSQCAVLDTLITLSCCNTVPEYEDFDSICVGDQGQIGSTDEVIIMEGFTNSYNMNQWTVDNRGNITTGSNNQTYWGLYTRDANCSASGSGICPYRRAYGGSGNSAFHLTRWSNRRNTTSTLTSPPVNVPYNPMLVYISFSYVAIAFDDGSGQGYNNLELAYSTSPNGPWTPLWGSGGGDVDPYDSPTQWEDTAFSLSSLPGPGTYYFRFTSSGDGYLTGLDNFKVSANTIRTVPSQLEHSASGDQVTVRMPWTVPGRCNVERVTTWRVYDTSQSEITVHNPNSYTWTSGTGQTYTQSGDYTYNNNGNLKNMHHCDSTVILHLHLDQDSREDVYNVACDSYTWINGHTYTATTTDSTVTTNSYGGRHTIVLHITINRTPPPYSQEVESCERYTTLIGSTSRTFTTTTSFDTIIRSRKGCDSVMHLDVKINRNTTAPPMEVSSCNDYTWPFNGQRYSAGGTYSHTIPNGNHKGCDTTGTLVLTISNSINIPVNKDTCDHYLWNGTDYSTSGSYSVQGQSVQGCDSTTTLHLTIHNSSNIDTAISVCDSLTWHGTILRATATHSDTLQTSHGCDSITRLNLTVRHSSKAATVYERHCNEYTWAVNNQHYTTTGIYEHTLPGANREGCDSVATIDLTIDHDTTLPFERISVCDSFYWSVNDSIYTASGIYSDTLTTTHGCDSVMGIDLAISLSRRTDTTMSECDSLRWNGTVFYASVSHTDTLTTFGAGCDSIVTLTLTVRHSSNAGTVNERHCDHYIWPLNGRTYTASGRYEDTTRNGNAAGCDSVAAIDLVIDSNQHTDVPIDTCDTYYWELGNMHYTRNYTRTDTLRTVHGCDSTITMRLTIRHSTRDTVVEDHCDTFTWAVSTERTFSQSGTYTDTMQNAVGCDSINVLILTVRHSTTAPNIQTRTCDSFYWDATDMTYTTSGTYPHTLTNTANCDSNVTLDLTINYSNVGDTQYVRNCNSYMWTENWQTYDSNGIYLDTTRNRAGCDSLLILNLTIVHTPALQLSGNDTITICSHATLSASGADSYTWYPTAPITDTITSGSSMTIRVRPMQSELFVITGYRLDANGNRICSSTGNIRIHVTIDTLRQRACDNFTWGSRGRNYTASGTYTDTIRTADGCDSLARLRLTINKSGKRIDSANVCDSYLWLADSTTRYTSTIDTLHLWTQHDCDSLRILRLTIRYSSPTDTTAVERCDEYRWPFNNQIYKTNTSTSLRKENMSGCDSIGVLMLTVYHKTLDSIFVTRCDSYYWQPSGQEYHTSTIDTVHNNTTHGCDSTTILLLTINYSDTTTYYHTTCDNHPYSFGGATFTSNGTYTYTIRNGNRYGCDSVQRLYLTVNPAYETIYYDTVAQDSLPYLAPDGNTYYYGFRNTTFELTTVKGCDSVLHLNLYVQYKMIDCDGTLTFPNLVTPNGDGENDTYSIIGLDKGCWPHNEFQILNRWGAIVFKDKDITDGTDIWNPEKMPAGTYYYLFIGSNPQKSIRRQGVIEVIK